MKGLDLSDAALKAADLSLLTDEGELSLIARMAEFPRIVEQAARADEPHRMAFYLHQLGIRTAPALEPRQGDAAITFR